MTVTVAQFKDFLTLVEDAIACYREGFKNIGDDESLLIQGASVAMDTGVLVVGGPAAALIVPLAEIGIAYVMANNTQGQPGSITPMHGSGARGNIGAGGGQIP